MNETYKKIAIIIPALNPDHQLIQLIDRLKKEGFYHIIVVNDGSQKEYTTIFNQINEKATLLTHDENRGKGRALKTAMNEILTHKLAVLGVVTVDADGQHSIKDIMQIANTLIAHPDKMILGTRNFNLRNVPVASKIGNEVSAHLYHSYTGKSIVDTQTGLRGIPYHYLKKIIDIEGERYEYEFNSLLKLRELEMDILEVPIETIYIDNNKKSHFHIIHDSYRVYKVFLKYILSSVASFVIDISLFTLFVNLTSFMGAYSIFGATVIARIVSSYSNFTLNKKVVFGAYGKKQKRKYFSICSIQMLLSALFVFIIYKNIPVNEVMIKVVVDTLLFLISFLIQKNWVFKK